MAIQLVVLQPFLSFKKGDVIGSADEIQRILTSEHRKFVMKIGPVAPAKG